MSFFFPSNFSQAGLLSIIFVFPRHADSSHSQGGTVPGSDGHTWYLCKRGEPQVPRSALWVQLTCYASPEYKAKFQIYYVSNSQCQLTTPAYSSANSAGAQFSCQTIFFQPFKPIPNLKVTTKEDLLQASLRNFFFFFYPFFPPSLYLVSAMKLCNLRFTLIISRSTIINNSIVKWADWNR